MQHSSQSPRSAREYAGLVLRGCCMGAADIVPGVSGGTMAFILGIYEELVDSIRTVGRPAFFRPLLHGRLLAAFHAINGMFLIAIGAGIALAVLTLSHALEYLLHTHPILIWSFFFGLVLASVVVVAKRIPQWTLQLFLIGIFGAIFAYVLVGLVPVQTPNAPWFLVLSGAIAICAMILPGISGSFLLVLLGKYEFVLRAVNERDLVSVGYIGIGAAAGIVLFSQVLSWLLHRYHDLTVAFLTGLMLGSLRKIWPWKVGDANVLPHMGSGSMPNQEFLVGIGLMLGGLLLVIVLDKYAAKKS